MEELNPSNLGTQEFWNERYKDEILNFRDHGEVGDVWFGESSVNRVCKWIYKQNIISKDSKIIDLGCGNGILLLELAKNGYTNLHGVDYSEEGIVLAKEIAASEKININYEVLDILTSDTFSCYDIVHDKGTYDAISLSTEARTNRLKYIENIQKILSLNGYFIITSCNWTKPELESHFSPNLILYQVIPTPQFSFGGQSGNTVTSLVFKKK